MTLGHSLITRVTSATFLYVWSASLTISYLLNMQHTAAITKLANLENFKFASFGNITFGVFDKHQKFQKLTQRKELKKWGGRITFSHLLSVRGKHVDLCAMTPLCIKTCNQTFSLIVMFDRLWKKFKRKCFLQHLHLIKVRNYKALMVFFSWNSLVERLVFWGLFCCMTHLSWNLDQGQMSWKFLLIFASIIQTSLLL